MFSDLEVNVFVSVIDNDGSFILETKLNNSQYLIEFMDEQGKVKYFCADISLIDYPNMYEYEGKL